MLSRATRSVRCALRCALVVALAAAGVAAQLPSSEAAKLTGSFFVKSYGQSVATSGERVVVGSPFESNDTGRVYIYGISGDRWTPEGSIQPDMPHTIDLFGAAVEIDGDVLVVGAPGETLNTNGKAFIFGRDGFGWVQELAVVGESGADYLGSDVAVAGDLVAIGVPGDDDVVGNGGAVLLYRNIGGEWVYEEKLRAPVALANANLGTAVAVAVAAGGDRVLAAGVVGEAHVYVKTGAGWTHEQTLVGDAGLDSGFGLALAMDAGEALVGARSEALGGSAFGAAYVYRLACGGWEREAKLVSPQPGIQSFGRAVDIDGDVAVVGDNTDAVAGAAAGAAFAWRWNGIAWNFEQSLLPGDVAAGDQFGWSVGVGGDVIVVSAVQDDDIATNSGAAYVFEGAPVFAPWTDLGQALAGGAGPPSLLGGGSLVVGEPVQVTVQCGAAGAPATLVIGLSLLGAPFKGGVMVPFPDLYVPLALDANGRSVLSAAWPPGAPSGLDFVMQAWITDAGAPAGVSATNGVQGSVP